MSVIRNPFNEEPQPVICQRCGIGMDTDRDGDCIYCAGMTDSQVQHLLGRHRPAEDSPEDGA